MWGVRALGKYLDKDSCLLEFPKKRQKTPLVHLHDIRGLMQLFLPKEFPWHDRPNWFFQTGTAAPRSAGMFLACVTALLAAGCATTLEPTALPNLNTPSQASPELPISEPIDLTTSLAQALAASPPVEAPCDIRACLDPLRSALVAQEFKQLYLKTDVPLRPPLRQTWFHHARLVPLGDDMELSLPHSEILAHREPGPLGAFRNPYAGLRDQAILHRDTSRAPVKESTLPEVGPPPPRHTIKTLGTLVGLSLVGIGVYAFAPSSFTGTSKDEDVFGEARDHFKRAWTQPPIFDKDGADVNYLGHPWFGMNYYLSQRNYGESPLYSFLFSAFVSTGFEYFIESWSERPSIQDLLITPIVGSILGELVFRATQEMRKDGLTTGEKVILTIINPLYVVQNGYR
jgi:hypothetical protein